MNPIPPESDLEPYTRRFLMVSIGQDIYGIPADSIREVVEYTPVTTIPMCPDTIKGIINVRGSVIPVIDIAKRLTLETEMIYDKYSCVVIYEVQPDSFGEAMNLGVLVSRVSSIESVQTDNTSPLPCSGIPIPMKFIANMALVKNRLCTLLDMKVLLDVYEINQQIKSGQKQLFNSFSS